MSELTKDDAPFSLNEDELAFFKAQTKIDDDEALKNHISTVQAKAYKIYPYGSIRTFKFTKFRASYVPAYHGVVELAKERKNAILLDVGCCFGCDLRKTTADGWPVENVIGFDLHQAFWDYGHELFRSTPKAFPAAFIAGDIFDPTMLTLRAPFYATSEQLLSPRPGLRSITCLTPLQGHISAICASAFFHLFDESEQRQIAQKLASLISPLPGSTIFGVQRGLPVKGIISSRIGGQLFFHSPDSWKELWDGEVFEKGTVKVEADIFPYVRGTEIAHWMQWSVTRLEIDPSNVLGCST